MIALKRELRFLDVDIIDQHERLRTVKDSDVDAIASSISSIGLRTPISVRYYDERPDRIPGDTSDAMVLLTGANRLAAAKKLGWEKIECFIYFDGDEVDAQLWEIAENLHRAELTALERDEQVALWVRLNSERVLAQVEAKPQGGRPEGGVRAAARELGIEKEDARRAVKIASLSDEAKEAARKAGLDDNRTALLEAAKHDTAEAQVKALKDRSEKRGALKSEETLEPDFDPLAVRAFVAPKPDYNGLSADERIAELIDHVAALEGDIKDYVAELKTYREMKVLFEKGGFEAVVAAKDELIRSMETRNYAESAAKADWMRKAKFWEKEAKRLGWRDTRTDGAASDVPSEYDDAFYAATQAEG